MKTRRSIILALLSLVTVLGMLSVGAVAVSADDTEWLTEEDVVSVAPGSGRLHAEGDGIAALGGRGIVDVTGNGILWVRDLRGDARIAVTGYGEKEEFEDGWIQYSGFRGHARVVGSRIIVCIAGVDVDLHAAGTGRAILWGHGTCVRSGADTEETLDWSSGLGKWIRFGSARAEVSPAS